MRCASQCGCSDHPSTALLARQEIVGDDWATDLVNQVQYVVTEQDPALGLRLLQQISVEPHIASHAVHALSKRSVRPCDQVVGTRTPRGVHTAAENAPRAGPALYRSTILRVACRQRVFYLLCQAESLAPIVYALDDGGFLKPEYVWMTQVVGPVEKIAPRTLNLMHGMFFASVRVVRTPFFLLTCDFLTGHVCDRSGQLGEYQPTLRVISVGSHIFI